MDSERQVTSVRIDAEMQAPSGSTALEASPLDKEAVVVNPGDSLQKIVRFELREEGNHTLAVNLSYVETTISTDKPASSGRTRTFRKLYQFVARPCLGVRTKVSHLTGNSSDDESQPARYVLEAQLENYADGSITLEAATLNPKPAFKCTSLNWDARTPDMPHSEKPMMAPRDILQIAFLLLEQRNDGPDKEVTRDGRTLLGNLDIQWVTVMGDRGFLSTGWLTTKRK